MNKSLFVLAMALLGLISFSCQESGGSAELQQEVLASPEFSAFVAAYQSRGADLVKERQEQSRKAEEELANLDTREKIERREQMAQQRRAEQEKEQEMKKPLDERNKKISSLLSEEKKLSPEELKAAIREIDRSLGITQEMLVPARTQKMKTALADLMNRFPEIREQEATFLKDCLDAYGQDTKR
ncbi:MAG: hypothetical protein J5I98_22065 [Phaeodactylibacter sp.]|nr:hypothetical protein [Phaeodactylibacter sp.]